MVSSTPRPHFTPGKEPVTIVQEAGWAPGPVWTGGKSRPYQDSIPDRPARSSVAIPTELPGPQLMHVNELNTNKLLLYMNREALPHVQAIIHTHLQQASLYTKRETQHLHLALYERPFCAVIRSMHRLTTYHWT